MSSVFPQTDGAGKVVGAAGQETDPSDALDGGRKNMLKCIQRGEYVSLLQRKRKVSKCWKLHRH